MLIYKSVNVTKFSFPLFLQFSRAYDKEMRRSGRNTAKNNRQSIAFFETLMRSSAMPRVEEIATFFKYEKVECLFLLKLAIFYRNKVASEKTSFYL